MKEPSPEYLAAIQWKFLLEQLLKTRHPHIQLIVNNGPTKGIQNAERKH